MAGGWERVLPLKLGGCQLWALCHPLAHHKGAPRTLPKPERSQTPAEGRCWMKTPKLSQKSAGPMYRTSLKTAPASDLKRNSFFTLDPARKWVLVNLWLLLQLRGFQQNQEQLQTLHTPGQAASVKMGWKLKGNWASMGANQPWSWGPTEYMAKKMAIPGGTERHPES